MFGAVDAGRLAALPLLGGVSQEELDAVARVATGLEVPAATT